MPSLPTWLHGAAPSSAPVPGSAPPPPNTRYSRPKDPNAPDNRLLITSRCLYERQLPGGSYITAHVERLQSGYYDTPTIHEDLIPNVRFLAIRFVFHEASTEHRFKSAVVRLGLHDESEQPSGLPLPPQIGHPNNAQPSPIDHRMKPKFLRHAPHLLYGAMSPETLDWNFNLAGSLGVAQAPLSATINPSGGIKSSYKVYKMMKVQGSVRTNSSWYGKHYDIEDGELVWTLEENELQKSGLPREFTFVVMFTKGSSLNDTRLDIDIEPEVASWFGSFPQWWIQTLKYQPLIKEPLNLDKDIGQRFEPCDGIMGFNFAGLMSTFDDFVTLPGTLYSTNDWSSSSGPLGANQQTSDGDQATQNKTKQPASEDLANATNTLHLRIHLDQAQRQGASLTATAYPYPEPVVRSSKSPRHTPSPKLNARQETSGRSQIGRSNLPARRLTINGGTTSTSQRQRQPRTTPLQTHYEEQQREGKPVAKIAPQAPHHQQKYEYSFPESIFPSPPASSPPQTQRKSTPNHRHTVSASTTSSSVPAGHQITSDPATETPGAATNKTALVSHPSLRRSRSRSGLRPSSLISQPEDEEAISAAMDMLSGSPPPHAPPPPKIRSTPPVSMITSNNMTFATPRTRATLADLIEVERAENARIQRRISHQNPDSTYHSSAHHSNHGNTHTESNINTNNSARSYENIARPNALTNTTTTSDRDKKREKRYSMPVTNTGIGYPGAGTGTSMATSTGGISHAPSQDTNPNTHPKKPSQFQNTGNGRSSLMIPIGSKRDTSPISSINTNTGLGIGVAKPAGKPLGNHTSFPERDDDSGISSA